MDDQIVRLSEELLDKDWIEQIASYTFNACRRIDRRPIRRHDVMTVCGQICDHRCPKIAGSTGD